MSYHFVQNSFYCLGIWALKIYLKSVLTVEFAKLSENYPEYPFRRYTSAFEIFFPLLLVKILMLM